MICGLPREGIHSYRLFDFAVVDVLVTVAAAAAWTWIATAGMEHHPESFLIGLRWRMAVLVGAGVAAHYALGINTRLNVLLFGEV
jgi:hypothetical protein